MWRLFSSARLGFSALVLVLGLSACFGQMQDKHPDKVLTKRVALFKQFTRALEPIGLVVSGRRAYQKDEFVEMVQELQTLSTKPWPYFTADGNYPPTRAKAAVWEDPAAFKAAQAQYLASVNALRALAPEGNLPAIQAAAEAVGERCKACHTQFRYE